MSGTCSTCKRWANDSEFVGSCGLQLPPWIERAASGTFLPPDHHGGGMSVGVSKRTYPGEGCSFHEPRDAS